MLSLSRIALAKSSATRWVGLWATALHTPLQPEKADHQTLRMIVHISAGAERIRIRLSNLYGTQPILIGAAHVAKVHGKASIVPATDRTLTFAGQSKVEIPVGKSIESDPVDFKAAQFDDLAVSLYLDGACELDTAHTVAVQENYLSVPGNFAAAESFTVARSFGSWYLLSDVETVAAKTKAIVAFGDSITDGFSIPTNSNRRWPDLLAERLRLRGGEQTWSVLNAGIGGNRLLNDSIDTHSQRGFGVAAVKRFERDVLQKSGVVAVIVFIGINDIGQPAQDAPAVDIVSAAQMIEGYRQLAKRGHAKHLKMYIATLGPCGGMGGNYCAPGKEEMRLAVNKWIRNNKDFDGFFDFEHALRDPSNPSRLLAKYDSGDHLHPNDAGAQAIADAVDLALFR